MSLPAQLITNFEFKDTSNPLVKKPVVGSAKGMYTRFEIHKEYSGEASKEAGKESFRPIEVCRIRTDRFSEPAIMVKDLSVEQKMSLAQLYEQFKSQKNSSETSIFEWQAISDQDKAFLGGAGIFTVEQLASLEKEQRYTLGINAEEYHQKANMHLITKNETNEFGNAQIQALLREKEEMAARLKRFEDAEFERHATAVETPKKKSGFKPLEETNEKDSI